MACNKIFAILKSVQSLQYSLATSYARDISLTELISDNKVVVNNSWLEGAVLPSWRSRQTALKKAVPLLPDEIYFNKWVSDILFVRVNEIKCSIVCVTDKISARRFDQAGKIMIKGSWTQTIGPNRLSRFKMVFCTFWMD